MTRALVAFLAAAGICYALDFSAVSSVQIGGEEVSKIEIDGVEVWKRPWQNPYVTDGLVAMWDGEWNVGGGVHDDHATVWKDLAGNRDLTLNANGVSWAAKALVSEITTRNAAEYTGGIPIEQCYTVEIVKGTHIGYGVLVLGGTATQTDTVVLLAANTTQFRIATGASSPASRLEAARGARLEDIHHLSVRFSVPGSTGSSVLADGKSVELFHNTAAKGSADYTHICVFGRSKDDSYGGAVGYPSHGSCHCIRIYNRQLTDAEIAANYAVDKSRFPISGGGLLMTRPQLHEYLPEYDNPFSE